jgi:hypothetical protein
MKELYRSRGLSNQKVQKLLRRIEKVETDDDWDGVSSAVQIKFHFPGVKVNISAEKTVESSPGTLVLDKWTSGSGLIVDHHPTNHYEVANVLSFSKSGEIPTSRLVYMLLNKRLDADLFLSATAEVADGLYRTAMKNGSLSELHVRAPHYFLQSKIANQFLKEEEIYAMTDMMTIITKENPEYALRIGLNFYKSLPKTAEELRDSLDSEHKRLIDKYKKFVRDFDFKDFDRLEILGRKVRVIDRRGAGRFYVPLLEIARRKEYGNYILFKGKHISIRTNDSILLKAIFDRLDGVVIDRGGRAGAYGAKLRENMDYGHFRKLITAN